MRLISGWHLDTSMDLKLSIWLAIVAAGLILVMGQEHPIGSARITNEERSAYDFLLDAEEQLRDMTEQQTYIEWAYASNINDENERRKLSFQVRMDDLKLQLGLEAKKFDMTQIYDINLKRKLKWIRDLGVSALPADKLRRYHEITNQMEKLYSTAKVRSYENPNVYLNLEPDLTQRFAESRDHLELDYYWTQWREASGAKMRELYKEFIELTNEAARLNGYRDGTDMKTQAYESTNFVSEMERTWEGLKPLYEQLHAYVRSKLLQKYGYDVVDPKGPIPAHLLGNMWAQSWNNLGDLLRPFPSKPNIDVTQAMREQGWTPRTMFEKADEFFISLGMDPMPKEFWRGSIIERPPDGRELVCHASAWDFYNGKDFRIKQCTRVTAEDFVTVNHEMGHVQYFMSYKNQSFLYRDGANPGFHEGVADVLSLAVGTASYYQKLGLLPNNVNLHDKETDINILFDMALQKLVFMPFGYLVDKFRWDLYSRQVTKRRLNCHWVKLRADIQGVAPPIQRTEKQFDAGAKYHVAANVGYIRYFTAHIYEFQFYKALCQISGQYFPGDATKPLHKCNFFGSREAGRKLYEMLSLGSSKPWKETIEIMTGSSNMDTSAFREYFAPLEEWLRTYNRDNRNYVGWVVKDYHALCSDLHHSAATTLPVSVLPWFILHLLLILFIYH